MLIGVIRQRYRLAALDYLTEGKSATVFVSHDKRKVIKILYHATNVNGGEAWTSIERPGLNLPQVFFEQVGRWALRYPLLVAVAKWTQRRPLIRRIALRACSFARWSQYVDIETIKQASSVLPQDVVAPFRVQQGQWVVLPSRFGNRVLRVTTIEQQAVLRSLEDELGKVIRSGDLGAAKRLIDDALAIQVRMWRFRFFNSDANILSDTGFDYRGNLLFVDIGDLTCDYKTALELLQDMQKSFAHLFSVQSLQRLSPEVADYYCVQFERIFTPTNFRANWNAETTID